MRRTGTRRTFERSWFTCARSRRCATRFRLRARPRRTTAWCTASGSSGAPCRGAAEPSPLEAPAVAEETSRGPVVRAPPAPPAGAHRGQRPGLARHVDHACVGAASQQRQEGAHHVPGAEQVGLEGLAHLREIGVRGVLPGVVQDGGIVHQHIGPPELRGHARPGALDAIPIGYVELIRKNRAAGASIRGDRARGRFPLGLIPRAEHHRETPARQLPTHLEPDPAIRTRDERYGRSVHTASSLPLGSLKWKRRPPGNGYVLRTIVPPACLTFASIASSWA